MAVKSYYLRFGTGNPSSQTGLAPTFIVFRNSAGSTTSPSISELGSTGVYTFDYECTGTVAFVIDGATTGLQSADRYIAGSLDISDRLDEFIGRITDAVGFSSVFGQVLQGVAYGASLVQRVGQITDGAGFSTLFGQAIGSYDIGLTQADRIGQITDTAGFSSLFGQVIGAYGGNQTLLARVGEVTDVFGDNSTDPTSLFGFLKRCDLLLEGDSTYTKATGVLQMYDKTGATLIAQKTISDTGTAVTKT